MVTSVADMRSRPGLLLGSITPGLFWVSSSLESDRPLKINFFFRCYLFLLFFFLPLCFKFFLLLLFFSPREHILSLFEEKDTRILTECTRLVLTCLFHQDSREPWLRILTNDPDRANTLLDSITFTLASSTNGKSSQFSCNILQVQLITSWFCVEI